MIFLSREYNRELDGFSHRRRVNDGFLPEAILLAAIECLVLYKGSFVLDRHRSITHGLMTRLQTSLPAGYAEAGQAMVAKCLNAIAQESVAEFDALVMLSDVATLIRWVIYSIWPNGRPTLAELCRYFSLQLDFLSGDRLIRYKYSDGPHCFVTQTDGQTFLWLPRINLYTNARLFSKKETQPVVHGCGHLRQCSCPRFSIETICPRCFLPNNEVTLCADCQLEDLFKTGSPDSPRTAGELAALLPNRRRDLPKQCLACKAEKPKRCLCLCHLCYKQLQYSNPMCKLCHSELPGRFCQKCDQEFLMKDTTASLPRLCPNCDNPKVERRERNRDPYCMRCNGRSELQTDNCVLCRYCSGFVIEQNLRVIENIRSSSNVAELSLGDLVNLYQQLPEKPRILRCIHCLRDLPYGMELLCQACSQIVFPSQDAAPQPSWRLTDCIVCLQTTRCAIFFEKYLCQNCAFRFFKLNFVYADHQIVELDFGARQRLYEDLVLYGLAPSSELPCTICWRMGRLACWCTCYACYSQYNLRTCLNCFYAVHTKDATSGTCSLCPGLPSIKIVDLALCINCASMFYNNHQEYKTRGEPIKDLSTNLRQSVSKQLEALNSDPKWLCTSCNSFAPVDQDSVCSACQADSSTLE